jgi:release factor glutamine methyltransferase
MSVQESKKNWNVGEILDWSVHYLTEKAFENPRLNVEWLLCHTLQCKRIDLYANHDRPLNKSEIELFKSNLLRRVEQEPLQYIVCSADFMGLTFDVTTDVLIPRADTETLVEKALEVCRNTNGEPVRVLDIGTGSGAIAISIAFYLRKYSIPYSVTALDISEKAIAVAKMNSEKILGDDAINFVQANIFEESSLKDLYGSFEMIVSNPPYISDKEYEVLPKEVHDHEPAIALRASDDGLVFYKHIAQTAQHFFHSNLSKKHVFLEVGYDQADKVRSFLVEQGFATEVFKDYHKIDRVVCGTLNE